jgi:hypothetical protein
VESGHRVLTFPPSQGRSARVVITAVRSLGIRLFPLLVPPDLDNAERVLLQLDGFDPNSEHFRYPVLNDGSETLTTLGRVYLPSFHQAMAGLAALLDAADSGVRAMIDEIAAIEADSADDEIEEY